MLRWKVTWTCFAASVLLSFFLEFPLKCLSFLFCNHKGNVLSKPPAEGFSDHTDLSLSNGNLRPGGCLLWILGDLCQIQTAVMSLCMYEHVFVVVGSGAVSKKKDTLTFTNVRPKNPPKPSPAAAPRRTPSAGHSGRTGPPNNLKVRLTGVRHQTVSLGCVAELCCHVWVCRDPRQEPVTDITPAALPLRHLRGKETWRTWKTWTANWPTSSLMRS